jgi:flagellar assembly factor FliW
VTFPDGLPGFEDSRRYVLVTSPALDPLTLVQSADGAEPSFVAIDPMKIDGGYRAELVEADFTRLGAPEGAPLMWLALIAVQDDGTATANLRAPLVINPATMTGIQLIPADSRYSFAHPLRAA